MEGAADVREAALGFRWVNVTSPWWTRIGQNRDDRPYAVQATVGDFMEAFR